MFKENDFIGLALDGDVIRIAHLRKAGGVLYLEKIDNVTLPQAIKSDVAGRTTQNRNLNTEMEEADLPDDIFGLEEDYENTEGDEIDFNELEAEAQTASAEPDILDMVDESTEGQTNAFVLYSIFTRYSDNSIQLGLNIPAGSTIFQVINDTDFRDVKKKSLLEDLENKLESIYGEPPLSDNYNYHIREDGSLLLASVKETAALLRLTDEAGEFYNGKIRVQSVIPDEAALASLVKANYTLDSSKITAIIQFGKQSCRFLFMKGDEIKYVAPLVSQGINDDNVLNKVFSKLLFELDTGKVPGVDQIILANNEIGDEAINFFQQSFPNITVKNIAYNRNLFLVEPAKRETINAFSTAIAAAWGASEGENFSEHTFLPNYIRERQKTLKLAWHGMALLVLIFFVPIVFNHFYNKNTARLNELNSELRIVNSRIIQIEPIVQRTKEMSQNLSLLMSKLSLIDSLSTGSKEWSAKFSILNIQMDQISGSWFTSMTKTQKGIFIEGYTLYRNRVPAIVDIFAGATLLHVNIDEIRGEEIYQFSILIDAFTADSTLYSPDQPESIRKLLSN